MAGYMHVREPATGDSFSLMRLVLLIDGTSSFIRHLTPYGPEQRVDIFQGCNINIRLYYNATHERH